MPDYLSATETAEKWKVVKRWVTELCKEGRIPGAFQVAGNWAIPANAEKPADLRIKRGKYIKTVQKEKCAGCGAEDSNNEQG
jgi:hypothetical protein